MMFLLSSYLTHHPTQRHRSAPPLLIDRTRCWRCTKADSDPLSPSELCQPCRLFLLELGPDPKAET